jgi:hypothetical protein
MVAGVALVMLCSLALPERVALDPGISLSADDGEVKICRNTWNSFLNMEGDVDVREKSYPEQEIAT